MGKDKRLWRKLVKKLHRKKKRQLKAQGEQNKSSSLNETELDDTKNCTSPNSSDTEVDETFFLHQEEWERRQNEAEIVSKMKQIEAEWLAQIEAEQKKKIREEWEAKQEQERKLKEEKERLEQQLNEKKEAEFNDFLSFLSGDIDTPPTKYLLPEAILETETSCFYFSRTAACRFYDRCTKSHLRPTLSTAILIPNFFSHFKLEQSVRDEYDSDLGLEYEDEELFKEFLEFYDDVVPELRKCGTLIQFKVCCNLEPHLRGNVYVQYQTIREAVEAYRLFNGRFYNGKQLSLQFIKMDSWRSAICGSYLRRACIKGRTCNYLHVFRNPTKEFVKADHDWKETKSSFTAPATPQMLPDTSEPSPSRRNELPKSHVLISDSTHQERNEVHTDNYSKQKRDLVHEKRQYADKSRSEYANSNSKQVRKSKRSRSAKRKKSHKKEKKKSKKVKKSKKHHKKKTKD